MIEEWIVYPNIGAEPDEDVYIYEYEYEYDSDGYPTKRTHTTTYGSKEVTEYTYKEL